ncbi:ACR3 family arsenite efflux pump ArsB [Pseudoclavibacter chungangensis]|uniref:arsenic resistance protein n=1 Tax=Pseudoclavibacter chungangensis TaxID=587635 RepID=UPI00180A0259|nr:ACR3 family arsenite efflux pump ArsB [Pseudoclavibacter chungangensis]
MVVAWMERYQLPLYVGALLLGAVVGLVVPAAGAVAVHAVEPCLALLLYVTFLGIPMRRLGAALRDARFVGSLLVLNFLLVPPLAWLLSRLVAHDEALLVGVLFVLLTPCIDYVIVFAGIAGGDARRLLAAAPLLMVVQALLLPVFLFLFVGPDTASAVEPGPFLRALLVIVLLPLVAAWLTQLVAPRFGFEAAVERSANAAMVPLMMVTLAIVVASQIAGVGTELGALALAVPVFVLFVAVALPLGMLVGRVARIDVAGRRALVFSGATRNSLVVLPLALTLPDRFALAPLVVVTQTLVELGAMVLLVRIVPLLVRDARPGIERAG